jgi:predicted nucleic acid-binding Zn ribbon protein
LSAARSHVRRRRGHPEPLGEALGRLTKALGITKTLDEYGVLTTWSAVVGERIAGVTSALRIENGVLFVGVATAPWRAELSMQRHEIIRKINAALGKDVVREIRFR